MNTATTNQTKRRHGLITIAVVLLLLAAPGCSQTVDVYAHIQLDRRAEHSHPRKSSADVVIWLVPTRKNPPIAAPRAKQTYTLIQKDKKFTPHLLVVPTGSSVDFPNLDPFFHNVFSLFNGKRFDLGLYEAHTHRTVVFDRQGVSYIFCNIHPEMGAVIITLNTPYYGISTPDGSLVIHNVPPGSYRMDLWAEDVDKDRLNALSHIVEITSQDNQLGTFHLDTTGDVMDHHKNKFGETYPPANSNAY
ncbi:hypothetical protein GCM10011507_04840 [Edaphobacter acidisoli]|uniref:Rhamnogalacturonan lyase domain-containing protein n=1 Tax=Edaphobacter acidisoli TaxID=2040573 RepID=A0A916RHF4_9BACT|nr:hypothetical protein [Edaphobacter acidisoli]GGA56553.1 hypothetical protein GCM10011507_04840 [Edaphobacter acidisoli]